MRIVHVASGREWRGGQRQTWLLATELARLGVRQIVVTGRGGDLYRRLHRVGVPVRGCGWRAALDPRALIATTREAGAGAVLHAHDPHAFAIASAAARLSRAPLVVTRRVVFPLRRAAPWRRADRVVAISEAVRAQLVTDGIDPRRIVLVPSGVDLAGLARAIPGGFRTRLGIPGDSPFVVCVAALTVEKGLDVLLAAAGRLAERTPKMHWAIAGSGPLAGHLHRLAEGNGVAGNVHFLGHLDDPSALLAEADCVTMPSTSEGFGSSLLDAMALGKPIVASDVGGIPEVLGPAGVVIPPGNPVALGDAVTAVVETPALRERLGQAARERVTAFGADRMARAMVDVYRSVAQID